MALKVENQPHPNSLEDHYRHGEVIRGTSCSDVYANIFPTLRTFLRIP